MGRLSTRLAKIEQATEASGPSTEANRLLVSLLGRRDSLFWPWRTWGPHRPAVREMQREYLAGTVGLSARAQGESNWKAGHHTRNELIAAGLCTALQQGGQVTGLRLTDQGVADARALVGSRLRSLTLAPVLLDRLRSLEGREHCGRKWVREDELFVTELGTDPSEWEPLVELLLPFLTNGLIESNSDLWNRAYFAINADATVPDEPPSSLSAEPWADSEYIAAFDAERAALARLECTSGAVTVPIRCT